MKRILILTMLFAVMATGPAALCDSPAPDTSCKSAILMEHSSGQVIYEKNSHEKLPIASITKVMVLLIAMEQVDEGRLDLDNTVITGTKHAKSVGGSTIFLDEGERMPLRDIVKGICINSGNDAAVALAEHIGGSEEKFVELMNKKALALGMNDTHFVNASGLDADGHYSSAGDVALMSRELIRHSIILDFSKTWMDTLRGGKFELANTNKLLKLYKYTDGLKTGSTDEAKYCVSATAIKDDMRLISVILGASSGEKRFSEAKSLFEWGFANFTVKSLGRAGEEIATAGVMKGDVDTVRLLLASDMNVVLSRAQASGAKRDQSFESSLKAPFDKGFKAGEAVVKLGENVIARADIVTDSGTKKMNFFQAFAKLLRMWLRLGG